MLKSQQKVDIKLSKICQSHPAEIVFKFFTNFSSSSEDSRKCRRRFKLISDLLDSLKKGRTTSNSINDPDVSSYKQCLVGRGLYG